MDATPEQWRAIPGYEGLYEVSDLGRVRSLDRTIVDRNGRVMRWRGKLLKSTAAKSGHLIISLGRAEKRFVHQLVALAFIGPRPDGLEVCHANCIASDNRLVNLRYDTHQANIHDTIRAGRNHFLNRTHCPRGHLLQSPNLAMANQLLNRRLCLACNRTWAVVSRSDRDIKAKFQEISDRKYHEIMSRG